MVSDSIGSELFWSMTSERYIEVGLIPSHLKETSRATEIGFVSPGARALPDPTNMATCYSPDFPTSML